MDIKVRLQRVLQILENTESVATLTDIERDIVLDELREAYAEVKFGEKACAPEPNVEVAPIVEKPEDKAVAEEPAEEVEANDEEPEVEVEIIFDESEEESEEQEQEEQIVEQEVEHQEVQENEDQEVEHQEVSESEEQEVSESEEQELSAETPNAPNAPTEKSEEIEDNLSTLNSQLSTPKRSALLSLYDEVVPQSVVGEQFHEQPSVADMISCPKGVAESAPVASLRKAIGVADRFMLVRELFGGDVEAFDKTLDNLDAQPSIDDCIIYIAEHYAWPSNSEATKLVMDLLQRKYNNQKS